MSSRINHYHVLGVGPTVSAAEIKRAYRKLVKSYHPDVEGNGQSSEQKRLATEQMLRLNEAYEILMDHGKRDSYDRLIGLYRHKGVISNAQDSMDEDLERQRYLKRIYHPARQGIIRLLSAYQKQLRKLSLDIYDDELLAAFEMYVEQVESALCQGAQAFSQEKWPPTLNAAVQMMRNSIAQACDGLEEMRWFYKNFDYAHLYMAGNLFAIALDLAKDSLRLTKA